MTITLSIKDNTIRDELKKKYPCVDLGNKKLKITTNDIKRLMEELKKIWP